MLKKLKYIKVAGFILAIIICLLLLIGYKLSYKRDIEKIDNKILNF